MTCRFFMTCRLIPFIRESLTAVFRVMTECQHLPERADCWECHSRHTAPGDASTQMGKHIHTPQKVMWMHRFILSSIQLQIGMAVCGKTCGQSEDRRESSTQLFTGEQ